MFVSVAKLVFILILINKWQGILIIGRMKSGFLTINHQNILNFSHQFYLIASIYLILAFNINIILSNSQKYSKILYAKKSAQLNERFLYKIIFLFSYSTVTDLAKFLG